MSCDTAGGLLIYYYINFGIKLIMIMAPIILLVLGTIDFMGAVTAGDEKRMKKSIQTFLKRMLICVLILVLPTIISLIMSFSPKESTLFNCLDKATKENIKVLEEKEKANKESLLKKKQEEEEEKEDNKSANDDAKKEMLEEKSGVFEKELRGVAYNLYIPKNMTTNMPIFIYLHGAGLVNSSLNWMRTQEMSAILKKLYSGEENLPFIYITPKTPDWSTYGKTANGELVSKVVKEIIDNECNNYNCNKNKRIISGLSLGSMGVWDMANKYPNYFSAILPVSGIDGWQPKSIKPENFSNTYVMAVVGDSYVDKKNYLDYTKEVCNSINESKGKCDFVLIKGYEHGQMLVPTVTKDTINKLLSINL